MFKCICSGNLRLKYLYSRLFCCQRFKNLDELTRSPIPKKIIATFQPKSKIIVMTTFAMKNILRPKKTDHSAHLKTGDFYFPVKIAFAVVRFGDFTIRLKL